MFLCLIIREKIVFLKILGVFRSIEDIEGKFFEEFLLREILFESV